MLSRGNFDDSCRPCILGKDSDSGDALLKCNCLPKPDGVPQYTDILLGLAGTVSEFRTLYIVCPVRLTCVTQQTMSWQFDRLAGDWFAVRTRVRRALDLVLRM